MKTKSILTQNGKLLFLNNIISLEIVEAAEYYSGALSAYTDDLESVIIAEDVNGNEIFVGEYLNESAAEDVIKNIALWAATDNSVNPYIVWLDLPEFYPLCYDLKNNKA